MKEFWNVIQAVFAAVGGWLGYFLGGCDGLLYALLAFVVLDYIPGIMCAVVDQKLSSAVGFKGICRLYESSYNLIFYSQMKAGDYPSFSIDKRKVMCYLK